MKFLIFFLITVLTLSAAECSIEKTSDLNVHWTAYKTPEKIGVSGSFKSIVYRGEQKAENLEKLLVGAMVMLQTNNVDSQNSERDSKLVQFFFNLMSGQMIDTKVLSLKGDATHGKLILEVILNRKSKNVPMHYTVKDGVFSAEGVIDLADYNALSALKSINIACYDLHSGKTWQDVSIGFSFNLKEECDNDQ